MKRWFKFKESLKKNWKYILGISIVLIFVIVCLIVAMHLSGYNLITWLSKFWAWVVLALVIILLLVFTWFMLKIRKDK